MKSTHRVEIVPVELIPHPNADTLSVVKIFGYQCVVKTADWAGKNIGAYIPPDSVVPDTPEFAFLGDKKRIRARRFRGVMSQGLLMPPPEGANIGDDVAELMGVKHYEPPTLINKVTIGDCEEGPDGIPVYDIENFYRYPNLFREGEEVIITEKIHGTSARFVWSSQHNRIFCGSRRTWKKEGDNLWWKVYRDNPWIENFCLTFPNNVLYGEIYGFVQDLRYGHGVNEWSFRAFDILQSSGQWINACMFFDILNFLFEDTSFEHGLVPILYQGPYSAETLSQLISGPSVIPKANHCREGVVIKPARERWDIELGRIILKAVSPEYLERAK